MTSLLRNRLFSIFAVVTAVGLGSAGSIQGENWTRFRGNDGSGISQQKGIPTTWSPGEYEWNVEIPGIGHSSPVIWEDKLFVTSAIDKGAVRYLYCLNAKTGEQLWSRLVGMNRSRKHSKSSWASGTPATDGQHVFIAFADKESYTLTAYDFQGEIVWRRNFGPFDSAHGQGVSPIVFEDMVIIPNEQRGPSSLIALDRYTGKTRWSVLRPVNKAAYATPIIFQQDGQKPQLICSNPSQGIYSINPHTGGLNWNSGPLGHRTVGSPVNADGFIVQTAGGGGAGKMMFVVDPSTNAKNKKTRLVYKRDRVRTPYVPTPIGYQGHIYLWNDNGVVTCVETETGQNVWKERIGGNYSGSPICVDGKIYIISDKGEVAVIDASPNYKLHGKTALNDPSHATPAVANGRLYLRSYHRLASLRARP